MLAPDQRLPTTRRQEFARIATAEQDWIPP